MKLISSIVDRIHTFFHPAKPFEGKFGKCQSFSPERIALWKKHTGLSWSDTKKILSRIEVFDAPKIRQLIANKVNEREDIFKDEELFITSFGEAAKSGEVIFYEFRHTSNFEKRFALRSTFEIENFPSKSRIVFVDDLIGTGRQSVEFIQEKLFKLLKPSHRPCLFSLCGTRSGIAHVKENSGFEVLCARELTEESDDFLHPDNKIFSDKEKIKLQTINSMLGKNSYAIGLLVAFYYGTPNNTMPMIWKHGCKYTNLIGEESHWYALLPRKY